MASANEYNMQIVRGVTFQFTSTWKDAAGVAMNLTGYSAIFRAREHPELNSDPVIDLSVGDGIVLGGAAGTIAIEIADTVTSTFEWDHATYILVLRSSGSISYKLLGGILSVVNGT